MLTAPDRYGRLRGGEPGRARRKGWMKPRLRDQDDSPGAVPPPRVLPILRAALGAYRRQFVTILVMGLVVFAPAAIVDGIASRLAEGYIDDTRGWLQALLVALKIFDLGVGIGALTFFAGATDRLVAADRRGHGRLSLLVVARTLPWRRLVVADLLVWGFTAAAALAFVLPGALVYTLLCITGPIIIAEDLGPWRAVRRSVRLVWPHFLLAAIVVTLPTVVEEVTSDLFLESSVLERFSVKILADVALAVFVTSAIGVLEVTMAHSLIASDRAAGLEAADEGTAGAAADGPADRGAERSAELGAAGCEVSPAARESATGV
jgi:hypothetical protein